MNEKMIKIGVGLLLPGLLLSFFGIYVEDYLKSIVNELASGFSKGIESPQAKDMIERGRVGGISYIQWSGIFSTIAGIFLIVCGCITS